MFTGVVPPAGPHPFSAAAPEDDDALSPRQQTLMQNPAVFQKPLLAGLPSVGAAWQDPSVVRRPDLEVLLDNVRVHIEERINEQCMGLARLAAEHQQQQRDFQDQCFSYFQSLLNQGQATKQLILARKVSQEDGAEEGKPANSDCEQAPTAPTSPSPQPTGRSSPGAESYESCETSVVEMVKEETDPEADEADRKPQGRSYGHNAEPNEELWIDGETGLGGYYRGFRNIVEGVRFEYTFGALIVLNTITLGIQTDIKAHNKQHQAEIEEPVYFSALETGFAAVFLVELVARVIAARSCKSHFCNPWNIFDTFVVAMALLEECIKYGIGGDTIMGKISVFRMMRVAKLLRTLRIIRVVRAFRELRVVLMSIGRSVRALFWTLCLLGILIYFMTVLVLVELTSADQAYEGSDENAVLRRKLYSSLGRALFTVYQCTTGGLPWEVASSALEAVIPWSATLWILYISAVVFAISNVVTGIFVDQAMRSAQEDVRNVDQEEWEKREGMFFAIRHTLMQATVQGKSYVDRQSMVRLMKDKQMKKELSRADIDSRDALAFFDLVSGPKRRIKFRELDAFIEGCFRLKGFARNVDLAAVFYGTKLIIDRV